MVKLMDKPASAKRASPKAPAQVKLQMPAQETEWPAEGPHARGDLVNEAATPGSGLFSNTDKSHGKKVDPGAG